MYWFISIYLFIISISHILNKFLRNLNKLGFTLFLLFYWKFCYVFSFDYNTIFKEYEKGIMYYIIGAYIKLLFKRLIFFGI